MSDIMWIVSKSSELLKQHHLSSYIYSINQQNSLLRSSYLNTWAHNEELLKIAHDLSDKFSDIIFLKGISLIGDVYPDLGARFMSDIDILCPHRCLDELSYYLEKQSFNIMSKKNWYGDDFKIEFNKIENGRELNIEIHTDLFFHARNIQWNMKNDRLNKLSLEDNLCHIIGHCGFSHNFQKLYWLIDIYLYIKKYGDSIDRQKLMIRLKELRITKVFEATLYILDNYFDLPKKWKLLYKKQFYFFLIDEDFLLNPNQSGFKQYLLKHLLKDSFCDSIRYDFYWLMYKVKKNFIK